MLQLCKKRNIKWSAGLLLVLAILLVGQPVSAAESGNCGPSLTWHFSAGTLTIRGEGAMDDYYDGKLPPWHHLADQINKIVLPDGLTVIGRQAFFDCTALTAVSLPDSVRVIRPKAFYHCEKLRFVDFSDRLSVIGEAAFFGCRKLSAVTIPATVEEIGDKAFYLCESLVSITVPQSTEKLGAEVFAYCTSLMSVKIESNIRTVPAWMFYGCSHLIEIELPKTVSEIDDFAFQKCEDLSSVYHDGEKSTVNTIRKEIAEDLPIFNSTGYVGIGTVSDTVYSSQFEEDEEGNLLSQTNTTVYVDDALTLTTVVTVCPGSDADKSSYHSSLSLAVTDDKAWEDAKAEIDHVLRQINDDYSPHGEVTSSKLTVYVSDGADVDEAFVKSLTGRKVETEIVTADGSAWRLDCENLKTEDVTGKIDYSYQVDEVDAEVKEALGGAVGYRVSFNKSTQIKSQIMIQLPTATARNNAFLYQIENDGSYTRLQAVEVDSSGMAHFYLASVDKDTNYVIGMNVPGEKTDDVILSPDRLTQNSIQRLEQIEYVTTGARTLRGMTLTHVMLIVIGILVVVSIVVGVIMMMYYKSKMKVSSH